MRAATLAEPATSSRRTSEKKAAEGIRTPDVQLGKRDSERARFSGSANLSAA
jgi:hypothetical protein